MAEDLREELFNSWDRLKSSFQLLEILSENYQLDERVDDKRRRELIEKFFNLLIASVGSSKVTIVSKYGTRGFQVDWTEPLKKKFIIQFCIIPDGIVGFWDEDTKTMEVSFENKLELVKRLYQQNKIEEIIKLFQPVIFHELVHYFDFERYKDGKPFIFGGSLNSPQEFEAYFQQFADQCDKNLNRVKSKDDFFRYFTNSATEFIKSYWKIVPADIFKEIKNEENYYRKWSKRLFQLYNELLSEFNKRIKNDYRRK